MIYSKIYEWSYELVIKGINKEKDEKINVMINYNGKIRDVIQELRDLVEELVREGNSMLIIGQFKAPRGKRQVGEEEKLKEKRDSIDSVVNCKGR